MCILPEINELILKSELLQEMNEEGLEKLDSANGQLYVRLAQMDKDGRTNYSETILAKK